MNQINKLIFLIISIFFISCTEVIDVDLESGKERLVIDASINWEKGTSGENQQIKLSKSTAYFTQNENSSVTTAMVRVINTNTTEAFTFIHGGDGIYSTSNFVPIMNNTYKLEVLLDGKEYTATEVLTSVVSIDSVEQTINEGESDDEIEVTVYFNDPMDIENYYFTEFEVTEEPILILDSTSDDFSDGNQIFMRYESENIDIGDTVTVRVYGTSKSFYEYITLLIAQQDGGGPFQTTPAPLKGNCINNENEEVLGFFRLSEFVEIAKPIE